MYEYNECLGAIVLQIECVCVTFKVILANIMPIYLIVK